MGARLTRAKKKISVARIAYRVRVWDSPVVALNRAVAVAMVRGPDAALDEIAVLERDGRLAIAEPA